MRDPNKFNIRGNCPGCNRVWKELLSQDNVLSRLLSAIQGNFNIFDQAIENQNKMIAYWEQQAELFQNSGDSVSVIKFSAMADSAVTIRDDMIEMRKKLRGKHD